MNKEKIYKMLIMFGMGLFLTTFVFHFDFPLKTILILSVGFGITIGGLTSLIDLKSNKKDEN